MNWFLIRIIDKFVGIPLILAAAFASKLFCVKKTAADPRTILLIKFWGLGNVMMLLPCVWALKQRYPNASLDILTLSQNESALSAMKPFSSVLTIDTKNPRAFVGSLLHTIKTVSNAYDLVIDCEEFARVSALITVAARAPRSIGFRTFGQLRHFGYTDVVSYEDDRHVHLTFTQLLAPLHISVDTGNRPVPFKHPCAVDFTAPYAVIHPGTSINAPLRRWPAERYALVCAHLAQHRGLKIILTGTPEERTLCQRIADLTTLDDNVSVSCDRDLPSFCALIENASLVIAADTLAVHAASYFNRPVIGLYGPNTPLLYGPWSNFNDKFNVCRHRLGKGHCMSVIEPSAVINAADELLTSP